ncbi:MAG: hypothetical protein J6M35_09135 [Clostridia bacterium]|nr:hypothetical protein [Clostridia bacterium]
MKKVISLLLVTAMMLSSFAFSFSVVAETATTIGDICKDANGNSLTPHLVNNKQWTVNANGELYPANDWDPVFLLFDEELNANRIETRLHAPLAVGNNPAPTSDSGWTYVQTGVVFALEDYDNDYSFRTDSNDVTFYWLRVGAWNNLTLFKIGRDAEGTTSPLARQIGSAIELDDVNALNISDIETKGVNIAVEWDHQGNIKVYINDFAPFVFKDESKPLSGKGYGFCTNARYATTGANPNAPYSCRWFTSFTAGLPTFDNCKDGNENQLDTYYVNSANAWTYESGKLDISTSATEALLLFDKPLNQNIIEVDFYTPTNGKSDGIKEGIVFAYDEATNSYYWLYVSNDQRLRLAKIVNGAQEGGLLLNESVENILKDSEANNITVTWNETTGAIDISFNGQNYPATDTSALTGDLYGLLVKNTSGSDSGSYFASFKAGTETTIIATPGLPEKVGHSAGTTFNASITADVWNESDNYKAIEMVITIPEKVTVTNVTAGNRLNGGQLSWKQDGTTLRISYLSTTYDNITITPNSELKAELFNIEFCVEDDLTVGETFDVTLVEAELALKSDTSAPDYNVNILPTEETDRTASAEIVEGTTFTVKDLYTGAGFDVIPADKKAILVTVTNPENTNELTYNDGTTTIIFKYNAEISAKLSTDGSIIAYVALVDVNTTIEATGKNFTFGDTASNLIFGDVNNDGILNASDALAVINMWLRADTEITDDKILAANVNGDGNIDTYDALGIVENFVKDFDYVIITKVVATNN